VPNNSKDASTTAKGSMPFEEAMGKLESIVESMESGELPLEKLLAQFEEGTKLIKICQAKLEEADLKIKQLEKNATGETVLKAWAPGEQED
jgi:exodeoxyribonuclease VII small subunit